jgi:hypothetical protein
VFTRTCAVLAVCAALATPAVARTPAEYHRSRTCRAHIPLLVRQQQDVLPVSSSLEMRNDGGWCGWLATAVMRSLLFAPTINLAVPPSHGQILIAPEGKGTRIAYKPSAGFVGTDTFTVSDPLTGIDRLVTVTVLQ